MEDAGPSMIAAPTVLKKFFYGHEEPSEELEHAASRHAYEDDHQRGANFWDFIGNHGKPGFPRGYRARRFAESMTLAGESTTATANKLLTAFDWAGLRDATVVDVSLLLPLVPCKGY